MTDAQRDMVQILKDMKRSMDESNKELRKIGENFAREAAKANHPSSGLRITPDILIEAPVEIDWTNPSIRGRARFYKDAVDRVHIDIEVHPSETERILELIGAGFTEKLSLTSWG